MHPLELRLWPWRRRDHLTWSSVLILAATLVACSGTGTTSVPSEPSASASSSGPEFGVISTLHGLTTLPHRVQWEATPRESAGGVQEVDFLIDDQLAWVEHNAPYFYADDGNWLVTTSSSPRPTPS